MRDTLELLLRLRSEGMLARFAIGGAVAASYYIEAVATEDLDVFALGGNLEGEHVVIHGWPVSVPVVGAEHLCAIALQTGRPKDYLRVYSMIEAGCVDSAALARLVETHDLSGRWSIYARRYT